MSASVIDGCPRTLLQWACARRRAPALFDSGTSPLTVPSPPISAKSAGNWNWWQAGKNLTLLKYANTLFGWSVDLHLRVF
jgi:hypothetical protein